MNRTKNLSRNFKTKKKKKHMKILKITKFKIVFLLPFTSCRKVLGKMPAFFAKLANNFFLTNGSFSLPEPNFNVLCWKIQEKQLIHIFPNFLLHCTSIPLRCAILLFRIRYSLNSRDFTISFKDKWCSFEPRISGVAVQCPNH